HRARRFATCFSGICRGRRLGARTGALTESTGTRSGRLDKSVQSLINKPKTPSSIRQLRTQSITSLVALRMRQFIKSTVIICLLLGAGRRNSECRPPSSVSAQSWGDETETIYDLVAAGGGCGRRRRAAAADGGGGRWLQTAAPVPSHARRGTSAVQQ